MYSFLLLPVTLQSVTADITSFKCTKAGGGQNQNSGLSIGYTKIEPAFVHEKEKNRQTANKLISFFVCIHLS